MDPEYTEREGSSFVLREPPREVFNSGLTFKVLDWDRIKLGKDDDLGYVNVPAETLYANSNGANMEFKLLPPPWKKDSDDVGYISIRCLPAAKKKEQEEKGFLGKLAAVPVDAIEKVAEHLPEHMHMKPRGTFVMLKQCIDIMFVDLPSTGLISCRNSCKCS